MKKLTHFLLVGTILMAGGLANAQVKLTPATIGLVQGGNPQGFITGSNEKGIFFTTNENTPGQFNAFTNIRGEGLDKAIRLNDRSEALADARALYSAGKYAEAAPAFGQAARNYALILSIPQNFSIEAVFYQLESLRKAGDYAALAGLLEAPVVASINTKLGDSYKKPFEFQKLWGLYGANNMAGLKAALESYQEPVLGDAKMLRTPNFRAMPVNEMVQIAFLRAKVYESEKASDKALEDYYKAFTLGFANDPLIAEQAMIAAMAIQKADPALASEKNKSPLRQMQSLAYTFSQIYGKDKVPAEYSEYVVRPEMPKAPEPPKEEEKPAEGEGAKEGDAAKPAADGEKPADAAKGPEEKPAPKAKRKKKKAK